MILAEPRPTPRLAPLDDRMIDSLPIAVTTVGTLAPLTPGSATVSRDFAQTFGSFLDTRDAAVRSAGQDPDKDRQDPADDGTDLPPAPVAGDTAPTDPLIAWALAVSLPPSPPPDSDGTRAAPPIAVAQAVSSAPTSGSPPIGGPNFAPTIASAAAPLPDTASDAATAVPAAAASRIARGAGPATATSTPVAPGTDLQLARLTPAPTIPASATRPAPYGFASAPQTQPTAREPIATTVVPATPAALPKADAPRTLAIDDQQSVAPAPAPPSALMSNIPQPAREVFASAIAAAAGWRDRPARTEPAPTTTVIAAALDLPARTVVTAASAAQDAPLDLARDTGLHGMIDRIETLRDQADAGDTRIRLAPDALGGVDVAVRRDGDAVRVHFTAERAATQTLLIDAQPRLTDLAAARGVRIAETSVSTGFAQQQGQGANPQPQLQSPSQPRGAFRRPADAAAPDPSTDQRLA